MNNQVLEMYVKLKDLTKSGFSEIIQNAKKAFETVTSFTKKSEQAGNTYHKTLGSIYDKMNDLKKFRMDEALGTKQIRAATSEIKTLQKEIDRLEGKSSRSGGIGSFLRPLIPAVGLASVMAFGTSSVKAAMDFGATKTSFGVLTGSTVIGDELAEKLRRLKQDTIMGVSVYANAQKMLGFGINSNKIVPDLKMLGDVSMGDADKLKRLTLAFSEVEASGKLNMRRTLQFVNAGFNPLLEISRTTGMSMEELSKKMKKGEISAVMLENAFKSATGEGGRFHDMLDKMAETPAGKMKKLEGQWAAFKIDVGESMMPFATGLLTNASKLLHTFQNMFELPASLKTQATIDKIHALQIELSNTNTTHDRQLEIYNQLKDINPQIVKGIDDQNIAYGKLADNINNVVGALEQKKISEVINEQNSDFLDTFSLYKSKFANASTEIYGLLGRVNDPRLADRKLTLGQKKLLAVKDLNARVNKESAHLIPTDDDLLLSNIQQNIGSYISSADQLNWMAPKFKEIQGQISAAKNIYEQTLGTSVTAANIKKKKTDDDNGGGGGKEVAQRIAGGGPRIININGVKFTDKIEIHATTMTEGESELEHKLEEMFLRILNSGASVQ